MEPYESVRQMAANVANNLINKNKANIARSTPDILKANEEQMDSGILSTGKRITPEYAPSYRKKKGFVYPNLKDTGAFRNAMYVDLKPKTFSIWSTDSKTNDLVDKYTRDIFGLTEAHGVEIFNKIYEQNLKYLNRNANKFL